MNLQIKKIITSTVMIGSVILMIVLSEPRTTTWTDSSQVRSYLLGISGLVGMVVMTRQVILGIRPAWGWWIKDLFWVNGIHKRLGIGTLMAIILHPIAAVVSYGTSWTYAVLFDFSSSFEGWVSLGKIAFDLIIVVLITSILSRKLMSFRTWHRVHLLSYPAFIAVRLHARFTGSTINEVPLVRGYRVALGIILLAATIVRVCYQYGYLKIHGTQINHKKITGDTYELTIKLDHNINYQPGQFIYLQHTRGGESHPFTILEYCPSTHLLKIAYKALGSFTQQLTTYTQANHTYYIDGPYGNFLQETLSDYPIICIAGGIGVTPFYQLSQQHHDKDITLIYLNQTQETAAYYTQLNQLLGTKCINILSRATTQQRENDIIGSRLSEQVLKDIIGTKLQQAQYYICGGGSVITTTNTMLLSLGVPQSHIKREPFSM